MNSKRIRHLLLAACCALPVAALAGLVPPKPGQPVSTNYDIGYQDGFTAGTQNGREQCHNDPASCSIYLSNVLPDAQYGETEPNDTGISADPMTQHVNFWGQSYSQTDQDWYYLVTPEQNYNLTLNFSLPEATGNDLSGWNISVRNAIGMTLAEFETGFTTVEYANSGISYRTTLGLSGTYYIVVRPTEGQFSYQPYNLAVAIEPSPFDGPNFAGGFADAEVEPNNVPAESSRIAQGVTMYGLVNLQFESAICTATECTYGQDEADWYIYRSQGNEILQLAFCDRNQCSPGDWFVQVFDLPTADAIQNQGVNPDNAQPLMAFNTDTTSSTEDGTSLADVWQLGLQARGPYFIRVGHKRTLQAPCIQWTLDSDSNGIPDSYPGSCACTSGEPVCTIDIADPTGNTTQLIWPSCPDGSEGGASSLCPVSCVCIDQSCSLYQTDSDGDGLPGPNPQPCRCLPERTTLSCGVTVANPGTPMTAPGTIEANCLCSNTSGVVELPENEVSAQYNFTLTTSAFGSP
ncbi:hypothetical protein [Rhabdochromatium marinum]|uniref:hypothetical protein n=1 Tax=Rhabdochromatium marinum TaxID=48729 RepID=UPI0019062C24|nr:hypothetical protein [Rhabdochromatium marinum]MBK1649455.1 hypothetical protein [Rhabdochromatium marinum]